MMEEEQMSDTTTDRAATARADKARALQVERAGYVARGLTDRIAQVDAELDKLTPRDATPTPKAARVRG